MTPETITYLTFGGLLILALIFDLGLLSKKHTQITIGKPYGKHFLGKPRPCFFCICMD